MARVNGNVARLTAATIGSMVTAVWIPCNRFSPTDANCRYRNATTIPRHPNGRVGNWAFSSETPARSGHSGNYIRSASDWPVSASLAFHRPGGTSARRERLKNWARSRVPSTGLSSKGMDVCLSVNSADRRQASLSARPRRLIALRVIVLQAARRSRTVGPSAEVNKKRRFSRDIIHPNFFARWVALTTQINKLSYVGIKPKSI